MNNPFQIGAYIMAVVLYTAFISSGGELHKSQVSHKTVKLSQSSKQPTVVSTDKTPCTESKAVQVAKMAAATLVTGLCALYVSGTMGLCLKTSESIHPDFNMRRLAASVVFIYTGIEAGKYSYTTGMSLIGKKP